MNQKNLNYLRDNLKYLGFGEQLSETVEAGLQQGKPDFTVNYKTEYNRQTLEATLHFRKSDQSDMYFFNSYDAVLKHANDATLDRRYSFYINKGNGSTLKEAFNLLNGRAVNKDLLNKEGHTFNAWLQLDLKGKDQKGQYPMNMYHEHYGYDLEKVLSALPLKELKDPEQKENLLRSLQKGNVQSVTFLTEVGQQKRFIEAAPQFKSVNQYDEHFKPIRREFQKKEETNPSETKTARQKKEKEPGENDDGPGLKKKRSRKNGMSV